jgi:hypothetical protein
MSDKALIVTLLVPTLSEQGDDQGPMAGGIGTGCAVGPDLILTSRHVVRPSRRNPAHPIRVRWHPQRHDADGGWRDLHKDDAEAIRWCGDGALDAALLLAPRPPALEDLPPYRVAARRPKDNEPWAGRGYPRSHRGEDREPGDFVGKVMSAGASDPLFSLASELRTGERQQAWSGASGMAAVVDGDLVLGVVQAVPDRFDNRELKAVPAALLRADEGFCRALGLTPRPDLIARARALMVQALGASMPAVERLLQALVPGCRPASDCLDALADKALAMPLKALVEQALKAREQLRREQLHEAAAVVAEFIQALLPAAADAAKVDGLGDPAQWSSAALIRLEAHSPTMTEILMAAADRRSAVFRPLAEPNRNPVGEGLLGQVFAGAEVGRDRDGRQRTRDLAAGLGLLFEAVVDDRLDEAFFNHLRGILPPEYWDAPEAPEERRDWEQDLVDEINQALRGQAIRRMPYEGSFTYYLLAESPPRLTDAQRARRDAILARIRQRFPAIAVVCIEPRPGGALKELRPFGNLRELLYSPD